MVQHLHLQPARPAPSRARFWMLAASLMGYALVGWCVLGVIKAVVGDPVTIYLQSTHNNAVLAVSTVVLRSPCLVFVASPAACLMMASPACTPQASTLFHVILNAMVGFLVLTLLYRLVVDESAHETEQRERKLTLLRQYDEQWETDVAHCEEVMRVGSKSFFLAAWLLPGWMRGPSLALYSFCRKADDDVDEGDEAGAASRLARLRQRLADAYAGNPADTCVDRAFSACVRAFEIPREIPEAMLEGFQWDISRAEYHTYSSLVSYCSRVAATVGGMMTVVMGGHCAVMYARAFDLGVAMQLTNIARDVGEDARNGRIYIPGDWLREEGVNAQQLLDDVRFSPALGRAVERLLSRADYLYERSDAGISMLPRPCRPAIRAARLIYCEIGNEVRRRGLDSVSSRAVVTKKTKIFLALRAMLEMVRPDRAANLDPVLPECDYLLQSLLPLCTKSPCVQSEPGVVAVMV